MAQRDQNLYLDTIVIQAEGVLFKVPTSIFADSEVFHGMLGLPQQGTDDANSDVNPLVLPDMKASEFRVFTQAALAHIVNAVVQLSVSEWATVIKLSDKWTLDALHRYAIKHIEPLFDDDTSATQLSLAQRFAIQSWKYPAIERLISRERALDMSDINMLGSVTAVALWQIREANMRKLLPQRHVGRLKVDPSTPSLIEIMFGCEPDSENEPQPESTYLDFM